MNDYLGRLRGIEICFLEIGACAVNENLLMFFRIAARVGKEIHLFVGTGVICMVQTILEQRIYVPEERGSH